MSFFEPRKLYVSLLLSFLFLSFTAFAYSPTYQGKFTKWVMPPLNKPVPTKPIVFADVLLKPEKKVLIVIDPGHGGKDHGTYSKKTPKYHEKFLTLTTSYMLKTYLEKLGYDVIMTRTKDVFVPLENRSTLANELKPKLFVSIHFNSAPNRKAEGVEIFYYRSDGDKSRSNSSKALAQSILKRILKNTEAKSRGVKHGNLAVIRETQMPAVLIEGGFLTNEDELKLLKNGVYLKKLSWGIAQGIQDYLKK
jgi:N-acetylmuramoyl-L-alanine amidase